VTDADGKLLGVVNARDLLRVFLHPDEDIKADDDTRRPRPDEPDEAETPRSPVAARRLPDGTSRLLIRERYASPGRGRGSWSSPPKRSAS